MTYFRQEIEFDGNRVRGYLTYGIGHWRSNDRNILLVEDREALVPTGLTPEFDSFARRLDLQVQEGGGRFYGDKSFVNVLIDNPQEFPHGGVAIHKFGPVPVFLLPERHPVQRDGQVIQVQIGIHLNKYRSKQPEQRYLQLFSGSTPEFLRSLRTDLALIFRRYFEDVAASLFDLEIDCGLLRVFEEAKLIEEIIGQSIQSKLKLAIPKDEDWQLYKKGKKKTRSEAGLDNDAWNRCEFYERNRDVLIQASYTRLTFLYLLNELYQYIGINSESESYLDDFRKLRAFTDLQFGEGFLDDLIKSNPDLEQLQSILKAYGRNRIDLIANLDSQTYWVQRVLGFVRFLDSLRQEKISPIQGRIFISHHHNVPSTQVFKRRIEDLIAKSFSHQIEILSVEEPELGERFVETIKAKIWQSDLLIGIIPADSTPIGSHEASNYLWIACEAEHALLLGKPVIFMIEAGVDNDKVLKDFANESMGFLAPDSRKIGRAANLVDCYQKTVHIRNIPANSTSLDATAFPEATRRSIIRNVNKVLESRHNDILNGYFQFLSESTQQYIRAIHEAIPYPDRRQKSALANLIIARNKSLNLTSDQVKKAIDSMRKSLGERLLNFSGRDLEIISLHNRREYVAKLKEVLHLMRPDYNEAQLNEWLERLIDQLPSFQSSG
jgi:hypothetical protein